MTERRIGSPIKGVGDDEQGMDGQRPIQPPPLFDTAILPLVSCVGRGGASVPNRPLRRGLFESFEKPQDRLREFPSHLRVRARAKMILGTLAETTVPRRAGRNPALKFNQPLSTSPTTGVNCRFLVEGSSLLR